MYTLGMVATKIYVVKSQHLVPAVQKASKTLSFRPFIQKAAKVMGDASPRVHELFGGELLDKTSVAMRSSLAPGPHLDAQNLRMGRRVLVDVDVLLESSQVKLMEWTTHAIVQATSCGVYGEAHPFRDQEVADAFW